MLETTGCEGKVGPLQASPAFPEGRTRVVLHSTYSVSGKLDWQPERAARREV